MLVARESELRELTAAMERVQGGLGCVFFLSGEPGIGKTRLADAVGTCWGQETALRMLSEAGFRNVAVKKVEGDILDNYYVARKGAGR